MVLGIAFLAGTMVLGDTLKATFNDLFTNVNKGTDAVVRSSTKIENNGDAQRPPIDAALVAKVRQVPGVAQAEPDISGYGVLVGKNGKPVTSNGPPTMAGNWLGPTALNPYRLADGRAPRTSDEVVIDRGLAKKAKLGVGDTTTVQLPDPTKVKIVGVATFGTADSAAGSTFTAFTTQGAQEQILHSTSKVSLVRIKAAAGTSQSEVAAQADKVLPKGIQAVTGATVTKEQKDQINSGFLNVFITFLLVFAIIALVVASFSIYNTFTIIMAQRTREAALLRALGASRRQVLGSVLLETVLVGLVGAIIGLGLGLLVAIGLQGLFSAFGADLPSHALIVKPTTIVAGLVVGLVVTVLAGLLPAIRSSRVAPLAALRDVDFDASSTSRLRLVIGSVFTAAGLALVIVSAFAANLVQFGFGAFLLVAGVVVLGPVIAGPAATTLGAPVARFRGITGSLARDNALRNPKRTASTASALLVGVAVVALFTVLGASIKASVNESVNKSFAGDLVVSSGQGGGGGQGFSPQVATRLNRVSQVKKAAGIGFGGAKINGDSRGIAVVNPSDLAGVLDLGVKRGNLSSLGEQQLAVSDQIAKDKKWTLGTPIAVQFPDGKMSSFTVGAIYDRRDVLGSVIIGAKAYTPHTFQNLDQFAFIKLAPGTSVEKGQAAVERVTQDFAGVKVQNRSQFRATIAQGVNTFLAFIYVMLLLAVIIALMGIANTLSLSVYERTREIGLLRAVGGVRGQVRGMVRWESVLISLFGTLGGIAVGVFLGWALVKAGSGNGLGTFDPGFAQLVIVLVVGAFVGMLAAIRPARRAAKLDVLQAIAT
ncbi:MAG: FtsX-like permease family protein [Actinomycetota bacterium]|nr:FtsX-like permease family protein [Actinomycetota bacterium]